MRSLGPSYLQQGIRSALGLTHISPSLWPADWEEKLVLLLNLLGHECGTRNLKVEPILTDPMEQRVFASRLRHRLEIMPLNECHPHHLRQILKSGKPLFRLPVKASGETLVIDSKKLLEDKTFVEPRERNATDKKQDERQYEFRLPSVSRMVLDGLLRMARQDIASAEERLRRIEHSAASHYSSLVTGYQSLDDHEGTNRIITSPLKIGMLRAGFGPGGASQEAEDLLHMFADRILPEGAGIFVASSFYHEKSSIPDGAERTVISELDRRLYNDSVTEPLFDKNSEVPADELQRRYDEAVETSARAVADWILKSGLDVLYVSQMANIHENPVVFPAILGAKLLVEHERGQQFQVIFRHNYFRDPEGSSPRIPIWNDRHPNLSPDLPGLLHLVDGPANQTIAGQQYGIDAHILQKWMSFPDISSILQVSPEVSGKVDRKQFLRHLKRFESSIRKPRKKFRRYLNDKFGIPENAVLILSPSRINREKRLDLTLDCMNMVRAELAGRNNEAPVHLLVLGEVTSATDHRTRWSGDEEEAVAKFRKQAHDLGVEDSVHFLGFVGHRKTADNPFTYDEIVRSIDIVSQQSGEETFGKTYLEAIARWSLLVLSNFAYPGKDFGKHFPTYQYVYSGFNVFVRYKEEESFNEGMIRRLVDALEDDDLRREMAYQNYYRAHFSAYNEVFALGYFADLLSTLSW